MTHTVRTMYEIRGRAAWITLDSPANRNALSTRMVEELHAHLGTAIRDPDVRAIVLTGTGKAFCAGADLKRGAGAPADENRASNPFVDLLRLIWDGPKPVIAAVNGHAFGGGLGLVAASDIVVAAATARFSFSEVRVGVIPAMISVVVLPRIGPHHTLRLFLTGERFSAEQAVAYQLVHRVVQPKALVDAVQEEIAQIVQGGPQAVSEAKRLVRAVSRLPVDEAFRYAEEKIAGRFASEEAAEGMAAFLGKRKPDWVD